MVSSEMDIAHSPVEGKTENRRKGKVAQKKLVKSAIFMLFSLAFAT